MSTTPLTDGMQALINYANETTGEADTTLSDAIDSLVSGYGSGGSSSPMDLIFPQMQLLATVADEIFVAESTIEPNTVIKSYSITLPSLAVPESEKFGVCAVCRFAEVVNGAVSTGSYAMGDNAIFSWVNLIGNDSPYLAGAYHFCPIHRDGNETRGSYITAGLTNYQYVINFDVPVKNGKNQTIEVKTGGGVTQKSGTYHVQILLYKYSLAGTLREDVNGNPIL